MRAREILGEAWRDTATGTSRAAVWCLIWILILGSAVALDTSTTAGILREQREFRERAADVHVVQAQGGIDARRCVALSSVAGVDGAIAVRGPAAERIVAVFPNRAIPSYEYAGDVTTVLRVTPVGDVGLLASEQLADALGSAASTAVDLRDGGRAPVLGTFAWPDDGRVSTYSGTVLEPVPVTGRFDQCWVRAWPIDTRITPLLLSVAEPGEDQPPAMGRLNERLGEGALTSELLARRATLGVRFAAIALCAALGFVAVRGRRVEIASNRQAGAPLPVLTVQQLLEAALWVLPAAIFVVTGSWLFTRSLVPGQDVPALVIDALLTTVAAVGVTLLSAATATVSVRRRSLYRYVKDR